MDARDVIIGQECICPDGLGRIDSFTLVHSGNDFNKVDSIYVNTYVGNRRCKWAAHNVELIDPRASAVVNVPSADSLESIAQAAAALDILGRRDLAAWLMRTHAALTRSHGVAVEPVVDSSKRDFIGADQHKPFVTVTSGMRGHFAVLMTWNKEGDGFYEPYATAPTSYEYKAEAIDYARTWADAENVEFRA